MLYSNTMIESRAIIFALLFLGGSNELNADCTSRLRALAKQGASLSASAAKNVVNATKTTIANHQYISAATAGALLASSAIYAIQPDHIKKGNINVVRLDWRSKALVGAFFGVPTGAALGCFAVSPYKTEILTNIGAVAIGSAVTYSVLYGALKAFDHLNIMLCK